MPDSNLERWRHAIRSPLTVWMVALALSSGVALGEVDRDAVILWHTLDQRQALFLDRLVGEFNATAPALAGHIKLETGMELVQALIESLDEGAPPDAVLAPADLLGLSDQLRLSEVPADLAGGRFGERVARTVRVDGKAYGAPIIDGNHLLLLFNRSLMKEPPARLEDFEAEAEAGAPSRIAWLFDDAYVFATFLTTFGWRLDGPSTKPAPFAGSAAVTTALAHYRRLTRALVPTECGYDCVTRSFYEGKLPAVINGEWALRDAADRLGANLGVGALPTVDGRPLIALSTTHALSFPGRALDGVKGATLRRFAKFLQSSVVQKRWHDEAERLPVDPAVLRAIKRSADARTRIVLEQLDRSERVPTSKAMAYAWPAMHKGLSLFLTNVQDAASASQYMQRLADTVTGAKAGPHGP